MTGKYEGGEARLLDVDTQFFVQFADQGLFGAFACLDLAAGEFPQARQVLTLGALGDQDAAIRIDQRHGDDEDGWNRPRICNLGHERPRHER